MGRGTMRWLEILIGTAVLGFVAAWVQASEPWKAGVAAVKITPPQPMWMSGYADRTQRAQGTVHDLWAKALALQSPDGHTAVLVTLDLIGIDRATWVAVCKATEERYGLRRDQVALNCSHTHCGPVVGRNLRPMYMLDEEEWRLIDQYTVWLRGRIVKAVGGALEGLSPATLAWGEGHTALAVNRRNNKHDQVVQLRKAGKLRGPVDHRVPVLRVRDRRGRTKAIVFGYACHATKLSHFYRWCGDYVGFAQLQIQQAHPGAVAMFWQGCAGDQTPWPRGGPDVAAAEAAGRQLADSVQRVMVGPLKPITGRLSTAYREIELPLSPLPARKELESLTRSRNPFKARHARRILQQLDAGRPVQQSYAGYPIQVWQLGSDVLFILLGGEVVVDYSLRLQREFPGRPVWVAGYTNDVMAYIPSRRVLNEGGYEGRTSMIYYGLPAPWAQGIEAAIVQQLHDLVRSMEDR